jgi:hypothetical protein
VLGFHHRYVPGNTLLTAPHLARCLPLPVEEIVEDLDRFLDGWIRRVAPRTPDRLNRPRLVDLDRVIVWPRACAPPPGR